MQSEAHPYSRLQAKRREQTPQALARLVVVGLFIGLWFVLWLARIPMPVPFLLVLLAEALFFVLYWRTVFLLPDVRSVQLAQYGMLAAEIVFHTTMVYFLGGISWLGAFAYVFGLIFANTFLDLRRGLIYTSGASLAFVALIVLEATGTVPHYVYLEQGALRYTDARFVATTIIAGFGVFSSIYLWVNWVGHQLRQERDAAVRAQDDLLEARSALQRANEELEERVKARTAELELANAAPRESEERLRTVVTNAPVVLFALDREGVFTLSEGRGLEALGLKPGEAVGQSVFDVYRDVPAILDNIRRALAGETFTATVDVEGLAFETHYTPIRNDSGEVAGVIGIATDITERKQAEEALRQSEEKYRRIYENVQDIYYETELNGTIVELSPSVERFGYTREELIGTSVLDIYESAEERTAFVETLLASGEVIDYELRLKAGDGRVVSASTSARIRRSPDGTPLGIEGALRDISERKQAEEALRESESKFRTMTETAAAATFIFQGDKMRYVNSAAEAITGYSRDELLAMNFWDVIHPDFQELVRERGRARQRGEQVPPGYEVKLLTKGGEELWVNFTAGIIDFEGQVAVLGTAFDITERKRAEDALREQARRDPLTGLLNHAAITDELRALIAEGGGDSHAVAMVDVDGLKTVNDTYGHQVGDVVLAAVAGALSRDGALGGRYGGDEFVVILPGADRPSAERYRSNVLEALEGANVIDPEAGTGVPVVASIGLAIYPDEADTIADLIRLADSAMYAARRQRPVEQADATATQPLGVDRAAEMVGQIVPLLTAPVRLEDKVRLVAQRISAGAGYDAVNVDIFSQRTGPPNTRNIYARVPNDLIEAWRAEQRRIDDDPFLQLLLRTRRGIIVEDPQNDERLMESKRAVLRAAQLRSAAVVPLFWEDEMIGTLSVASKREGALTPRDVQFLTTVATQVTAIVRMATLVDELQSSSSRLTQAHDETVMLLAAAAEARDHTTGLHLQNVRTLTEALARELDYSEEDTKGLGLAAVLHDIGKIRMPDSVLASSSPLTDKEWELMKQHTTWGGELLADRPGFELAAAIARSHHERWDGSGYPDGLAREEIPEAAAIVAVADAFDAVISDRPYRKSRAISRAVREIVACSGKQFSPKVADALLGLHKRKSLPLTAARSSRRAA